MMKKIVLNRVDEIVYYDKLFNGLEVFFLPNSKTNNFYITLTCKYGSLHNEFLVNEKKYFVPKGIAHFLEHVNFNEKNGKTAHDFFNKLGSSYNAFTTFDFTSYEVMSSSCFDENLSHLIEYVSTPIFSKKLVDKEKGIICEEVKMGKNNPGHKMFFESFQSLFLNDKRRELITGDIDDVMSITDKDLNLVYNTFYHPENMFLVITGNFDVNYAYDIIKRTYSKFDFGGFENPVICTNVEPLEVVDAFKVVRSSVEIPKVKISYKINREIFKNFRDEILDSYITAILHNNFGSTSEFRERLLKDGLVSFISTSCDVSHNLIVISVTFESEKIDEVIKLVEAQIDSMTISENDLIRKSRVDISCYINSFDDIEYVNSDFIEQLVVNGKIEENYYDMLNSLNFGEASWILHHLDFSHKSIYCLVPLDGDK